MSMYGNAMVSSFDMSQVTQMSLYLNGCGKNVFITFCFYFDSTVYVKYVLAIVIVMDINLDKCGQEVVKLSLCHICHSSMYDALWVGGLISISV